MRGFRVKGMPESRSASSTDSKCERHGPQRGSSTDGAPAGARTHPSDLQSSTRRGFCARRRRQSSHNWSSREDRKADRFRWYPGRHSGSPSVLTSRETPESQIGRASCRERGEIAVVAVSLKKEEGIRDVAVTGVQTCALPI